LHILERSDIVHPLDTFSGLHLYPSAFQDGAYSTPPTP